MPTLVRLRTNIVDDGICKRSPVFFERANSISATLPAPHLIVSTQRGHDHWHLQWPTGLVAATEMMADE